MGWGKVGGRRGTTAVAELTDHSKIGRRAPYRVGVGYIGEEEEDRGDT